jgi:hypothetical protein
VRFFDFAPAGASLRISPADSRSALPRSRPQLGSSSNLPVPTDESDDIYVSVPFGTAGWDVELIQYYEWNLTLRQNGTENVPW